MLVDSSTEYGALNIEHKDATDWISICQMVQLNLDNTSHHFKIQFYTEDGSISVSLRNVRILALRMDKFHSEEYKESRSVDTTTSSTFSIIGSATHTFTPAAEDYIQLYGAVSSGNNVSGQNGIQPRRGGTATQAEQIQAPDEQSSPQDRLSFFFFEKITETASSKAFDIRFRVANSTGTHSVYETSMAFLQLTGPTGWTGKINGVTDPGKINGIDVSTIQTING